MPVISAILYFYGAVISPMTMVVDDPNPELGVLLSIAIGNGFVGTVED